MIENMYICDCLAIHIDTPATAWWRGAQLAIQLWPRTRARCREVSAWASARATAQGRRARVGARLTRNRRAVHVHDPRGAHDTAGLQDEHMRSRQESRRGMMIRRGSNQSKQSELIALRTSKNKYSNSLTVSPRATPRGQRAACAVLIILVGITQNEPAGSSVNPFGLCSACPGLRKRIGGNWPSRFSSRIGGCLSLVLMCHLTWLHVAGNHRFPATWSVLSCVAPFQPCLPCLTIPRNLRAT